MPKLMPKLNHNAVDADVVEDVIDPAGEDPSVDVDAAAGVAAEDTEDMVDSEEDTDSEEDSEADAAELSEATLASKYILQINDTILS